LPALAAVKQPSDKLLSVAAIVSEHYARGAPLDSVGIVLARLAEAAPPVADAVVRGLSKGWPRGQPPRLDEQVEQALGRLAERLSPERRGALVRLATAWGSKQFEKYTAEVSRTLLDRVGNNSLPAEERIAAARELTAYRAVDRGLVSTLLAVLTPQTTPEAAVGILQALEQSEVRDAGRLILERLPALTPAVRAAGIRVLLSRPEWTRDFLTGADQGLVQITDLTLDQRQTLAQHPAADIRRRAADLLRRGGTLPSADRRKVIEELLPVT